MKKITFCLLLLLTLLQGHAQVLIGNGTDLKNLPINPYYGYSYSQSIYTAAEINATGNITSLSWYYGGPAENTIPNSQNLKVYLGHTTKTSFSSDSDWELSANLTEVYTGGITINGQGWASIIFATPFNYNGTDNLVVTTAELQPGYDNNGDFFLSHEVTGDRSMIYQNDTTLPNLTAPQDGGRQNFVPNIIFGGIAKACPTPFFLNTVMKTATSAMVVWGNSAQGEGDSSQYYVSELNVAPTASTEPTGNSASFAMPVGLDPDTVYYIWVRNVCGNTPAEWSYPTSFRTECNPVTSIAENFDTTSAGNLPACWASILRGSGLSSFASVGTFVGESYTGANSVKLVNADSPSTSEILLVSPKLSNLAAATNRLRFYADGTNVNELVIGTLNNNSSTATFTPLTNGTVATTAAYAQYSVDFSAYTGSDLYIGIKLNSASSYNPIVLDNIRWEANAACSDVTQVVVEGIQPESTTVTWDSTGATGWEVVYDEASEITDPALLTPITSTTTTKELTGLTVNTSYNVWVRSTCEAGSGAWIGPVPFKTSCLAVAEFNENFDAVTTPALPNCWSTIIRGTENPQYINIATNGFGASSAPNQLLITPGSYVTLGTQNDVILVSPKLSTVGTGTHRLKFSAKGGANFQVGTLNDVANSGIFTSLENITVTANYAEYVVDFTSYEGTDTYFAFRVNAAAAYGTSYIDNIKWEVSPLCADVTELTLQNVTETSGTISWDETSGSAWEVVYGAPTVTDPSILTPLLSADSASKEITGLEANTSYNAWVRTDCGTDKGAWIGPILFKTDCTPSETINENFDTTTTLLPSCWSSIVRGTPTAPSGAFAKVNANYVHSPTKSVQLYNPNQTDANDVILITPNLSNLGAGTHRLRFYSSYFYPSSIQVGTLDTNTAAAEFTVIQNIDINATYTEYIVDFTQWAGITDQYIGIRLSKNGVNSYAHIDDVVWEIAPICPGVTEVLAQDITASEAYVTWEIPTPETVSQVAYGVSTITDPELATIGEETTATDASLSELLPNTHYNVWVRSVCGDTNGEWIGPNVFLTKCTSTAAINENFDTTATPALPSCWSKIIEGSGSQFFASISNSTFEPYSAPNTIRITNSSNATVEKVILVSPPLENLAAGTHQLSFYLKGNNTIPGIQIGTLNDNSSAGIFTEFQTITATTTYTKVTIDFSTYEGLDYFIGIRHSGTNNTTISVDDIVWEETLSAPGFDNQNFRFYPNPVKDILNLSYEQNITDVVVYNLLGQEIITKTFKANQTQLDMSALASGTYIVKVTADTVNKTFKVVKE